ncbi:hypothetical protein [Algoriphagus hitonicola]
MLILTFGLAMGSPLHGISQNKTIEKLNKHFYPISEEDSASFSYFIMTSLTKDSVKLKRIFDRKNRLIKVIKTEPNTAEDFKEKTTETYDPQGNILSQRIANLANGKFIETFFFDEKQVGQVLFEGNQTYHVIRNGEEKPSMKNSNDFEPQFTEPLETWNLYLLNHLKIDQKKVKEANQRVIVGILVDEVGLVKKVEWANPLGAEPYVAERAIAAVKGWGRNFLPALDSFENPTKKWLYVPISYQKH